MADEMGEVAVGDRLDARLGYRMVEARDQVRRRIDKGSVEIKDDNGGRQEVDLAQRENIAVRVGEVAAECNGKCVWEGPGIRAEPLILAFVCSFGRVSVSTENG
ncbi:hypothetical protein D3C86_1943480 [compost metagenome]